MYSKEESTQLRKLFWTSFGKSFPRKWILYNTKIKDFSFKFVANKKNAMVCLDIESFDKAKNKALFDRLLELKNNLVEDYIPDVIYDEVFLLDNGKIIHRIYAKYNGVFNIHNKDTWHGAYHFFYEAMNQFELFYEDFEDYIKQAIYY
jgi:hypothetical protein